MAQPPLIFDRPLIARRLARRNGAPDFVTDLVLDDLGERLGTILRAFPKALIMGPDARLLPETARTGDSDSQLARVSTLVPASGFASVDPEALVLPETGYDLIVSVLDMQIVNDVPGFLARIRAHLAPDGLFMAAAIGGETLRELRLAFLAADEARHGGAAARIAPFVEVRAAGNLMQRAGFALPVTDVELHTVRYPDPIALMRELRAFGASNPLRDRPPLPLTRAGLLAAAQAYADAASDPDGRVRASLQILWLAGWAPHSGQQQPLRPGSAKTSLADALKATRQ